MARLIILRLLESYFRHRWLYLLPIILMLAIGVGYYFFIQEPVYIVRGVMYVQKETLLASLVGVRDEPINVATPAEATADEIDELLQTDAFVRSLIEESDLEARMAEGPEAVADTIDEVREAVWAETQGNNQVLIAAAWEEPAIALQLAEAMVDNYIQWRLNAERKESSVAQSFFDNLIGEYRTEVETARTELEQYLEAHPEPLRGERPATEQLEISRLQSAIDLAQSRLSAVQDKEEGARLTMAQTESSVRQTYFMIDAPSMPVEPAVSLRSRLQNVALFGLVGVVLSLLGVIGGALLDRSPRFPLDVEQATGLPVLAMVPESDPDHHPDPNQPAPSSAAHDDYHDSSGSKFAFNQPG